jgi:hypothetical protein
MMKKTNIVLLLMLLVNTITIAQNAFNPFSFPGRDINADKIVANSTLIIEASMINNKFRVLQMQTKGIPDPYGKTYALILIKPTAVLKGTCDTSKTYQFLIETGYYTHQDGGYDFSGNNGVEFVPQSGIFFIDENATSPNYNEPYDKAKFVKYYYGMGYSNNNKENILQYLLHNYNLNYSPLQNFNKTVPK